MPIYVQNFGWVGYLVKKILNFNSRFCFVMVFVPKTHAKTTPKIFIRNGLHPFLERFDSVGVILGLVFFTFCAKNTRQNGPKNLLSDRIASVPGEGLLSWSHSRASFFFVLCQKLTPKRLREFLFGTDCIHSQ